mmetsp:Transcript_8980/g.13496  ORF Transcript_8980/g.13496 Transcript_8980/m.13496 type:complete len:277 (-) Transcript_8980:124-954(-)
MTSSCLLLGGTFAFFIQFLLALICFLTLVVKRHFEYPKRDILVWTMDGMKQGVGSATGHFANIILSGVLAKGLVDGDECQWYCLNYLTDATFGVTFNVSALMFIEAVSSKLFLSDMRWFNFGEYGDPPSVSVWAVQLLVWLFIVLSGKVVIFSIFFFLSHYVDEFIRSLFSIFDGHPKVELVFVMIIIPFILNIFQFWVQDSFLKQKSEDMAHESNLDKSLRNGLLDTSPRGTTSRPVVRNSGGPVLSNSYNSWQQSENLLLTASDYHEDDEDWEL